MKEVNLGGRPPLFETPEKLLEAINNYFTSGVKKRTIVVGKGENKTTVELEVPTITGLSYYLGFESRQSFYDYEEKKEFTYIIKRARLFIETEYEECLQYGNVTGAIFALKNMGWVDKTVNEMTGANGGAIEVKSSPFERMREINGINDKTETSS